MKKTTRAIRFWKIFGLLLAFSLLTGCANASGEGGEVVFGRGILYARAASDEEAFRNVEIESGTQQLQQVIPDEDVPLAALPELEDVSAGDPSQQGWMLVRYAQSETDVVEPLWVGVWSETNGWIEAALDCQQLGLRILAGE